MASFKALNIESDDSSDSEVEDIKEIQIEEALKDYQTALKLHSQGPRSQKEAREAYETLFKSEIFKYNESQSEYARAEALADQSEKYGVYLIDLGDSATGAQGGVETGSNTLPQILHLSYKNRGQLYLEILQSQIQDIQARTHDGDTANPEENVAILSQARQALEDFTKALDKDELDLDLWRRAAKISKALGSDRTARFCLESALEDDLEDGTDEILGMPSIEATLTGNDLKKLQGDLQDDLNVDQPLPLAVERLQPPPEVKEKLRLYPFIPERLPTARPVAKEESAVMLTAETRSWLGVGRAILKQLDSESKGDSALQPANFVRIVFSDAPVKAEEVTENGVKNPNQIQTVVTDAASTESAQAETAKPVQTDVAMEDAPAASEPQEVANAPAGNEETSLSKSHSSRKRSTADADLQDDGGRSRSKRIRARESILNEGVNGETDPAASSTLNSAEVWESIQSDNYLYEVIQGICSKAKIEAFSEPTKLRRILANDQLTTDVPLAGAMREFYATMLNWNEDKTARLTAVESQEDASLNSRDTGLAAFLESSASPTKPGAPQDITQGVDQFVRLLEDLRLNVAEAAAAWLSCLLDAAVGRKVGLVEQDSSSYTIHTWSNSLKEVLQRLVAHVDDLLLPSMTAQADEVLLRLDEARRAGEDTISQADLAFIDSVESLFELHLDIYAEMVNPQNVPNPHKRMQQKLQVEQWGLLARAFATFLLQNDSDQAQRQILAFRHLWASTFEMRAAGDVSREHLLLCIHDLRRVASNEKYKILLPNNASMRELSAAAAEKEITKLETMDFFLSIFNRENTDAVDLIERLEPVLMMTEAHYSRKSLANGTRTESQSLEGITNGDETPASSRQSSADVLSEFLANSSSSLRLSLWKRLRESYEAINYPPKVLSIDLKSIELTLRELKGSAFAALDSEKRKSAILDSIVAVDELLKKINDTSEIYRNSFECLDMEDLRQALVILSEFWQLLHTVSLFDDHNLAILKGADMVNPFRTYADEIFHAPAMRFHEMQIRVYLLWYKILIQVMREDTQSFPNPFEVRWDYLRHVHYVLGVRRTCKSSDSLFLKFMKEELQSLSKNGVSCDDEYAQILLDLYDLFCFNQPLNKQDHGCDSDYLDRATAKDLVDFVLKKAQTVPVRDLIKTELGRTVDKLNDAMGIATGGLSHNLQRNKKMVQNFLKSPVDPLTLYRSMSGILDLSIAPIPASEAPLAAKGWLFLRGQMAFARYKSSKGKGSPGDTDELDEAITLFTQEVEYDIERWETWHSLAKTYDAYIEEKVVWSAEKFNSVEGSSELSSFQRQAIHCYSMAIAMATSTVKDTSEDTKEKLADIFYDCGMRMYSSAQAPFSMATFKLRDFPQRFSSSHHGGELYQRRSFKTLKPPHAWRLAHVMFDRADKLKPKQWLYHYMMGKCKWKLFMRTMEEGNEQTPLAEKAIDSFLGAIERLPERKGRKSDDEPILEPIYKTIASLHKLVTYGVLPADDAFETIDYLLQAQNQFDISKAPKFNPDEGFTPYVFAICKLLRSADKLRWHHRVVFKAAQVMFEQNGRDEAAAKAAKDYLLDQHMYSQKTLAINIWKPDVERPGRHWVYMTRYCEFLTELIDLTNDLESIQLLARRVRKKNTEFWEHERLWNQTLTTLLAMYRRHGDVPENHEDTVFRTMTSEEFAPKAEQIDAWLAAGDTAHPLIDIAREIAEIKKINGGLADLKPIDALLADTYATLFTRVLPTLPKPVRPPAPAAPSAAGTESLGGPNAGRMSIQNMVNLDGTSTFSAANSTLPASTANAAQSTSQSQPDTAPKRIKLVSHREVIKRCAEAGLAKSAAMAIKSTRTSDVRGGTGITSGTSGAGVSGPDATERGALGSEKRKRRTTGENEGNDADDESELSELDEEELRHGDGDGDDVNADGDERRPAGPKPVAFPNLGRQGDEGVGKATATANGNASGSGSGSGSGSADGDGGGGGEGVEKASTAEVPTPSANS